MMLSVYFIVLYTERVLLFEICLSRFRRALDGVQVHINGLLLALEVEIQSPVNLIKVNAKHGRQYADINHIADQVVEVRRNVWIISHDLFDGHWIGGNVAAA